MLKKWLLMAMFCLVPATHAASAPADTTSAVPKFVSITAGYSTVELDKRYESRYGLFALTETGDLYFCVYKPMGSIDFTHRRMRTVLDVNDSKWILIGNVWGSMSPPLPKK